MIRQQKNLNEHVVVHFPTCLGRFPYLPKMFEMVVSQSSPQESQTSGCSNKNLWGFPFSTASIDDLMPPNLSAAPPHKKRWVPVEEAHAYPKDVGSRFFSRHLNGWLQVPQDILRSKTASWLMAWKILFLHSKRRFQMFNISTRYEERFPFFLSSASQMLRKMFTSVVMSCAAAGSDLLPGGVARGIRDQMKLWVPWSRGHLRIMAPYRRRPEMCHDWSELSWIYFWRKHRINTGSFASLSLRRKGQATKGALLTTFLWQVGREWGERESWVTFQFSGFQCKVPDFFWG